MRKDLDQLWKLAEPYVQDAGFDLVEVQAGREPGGFVVRLFIDIQTPAVGAQSSAEGDSGIAPRDRTVSHEDCERVSRDVSAALDVANIISHAYQLEVSSPGLDRPLRRDRDFARFAGERARVRLQDGVEGRRNFSGTLLGAKDGVVEIECDGRPFQFSVKDLAKANLVPDWDKELKRSAS